jgi:hypothetical protein
VGVAVVVVEVSLVTSSEQEMTLSLSLELSEQGNISEQLWKSLLSYRGREKLVVEEHYRHEPSLTPPLA